MHTLISLIGFSPLFNRCMVAFPEDYKLLVPRLLIETMGSIFASFVTRIDTFTTEATAASRALVGGTFLVHRSIGEGWFRFYVKRSWLISKRTL